jgi:hypothetical protein
MSKRLVLLVWIFLALSPSVWAAKETISPFRLKSCSANTGQCVQILAARATRGYLSSTYFMEGPIELSDGTATTALSLNDGYFDISHGFVLVRGRPGIEEYGVDLSSAKITRFGDPGPPEQR